MKSSSRRGGFLLCLAVMGVLAWPLCGQAFDLGSDQNAAGGTLVGVGDGNTVYRQTTGAITNFYKWADSLGADIISTSVD